MQYFCFFLFCRLFYSKALLNAYVDYACYLHKLMYDIRHLKLSKMHLVKEHIFLIIKINVTFHNTSNIKLTLGFFVKITAY